MCALHVVGSIPTPSKTVGSSVWSERATVDHLVAGSNPARRKFLLCKYKEHYFNLYRIST